MANSKMQAPPVQIGEPIPGTDLVRRWQGGKEISPMYSGDTRDPLCDYHAIDHAERAGYRSVFVMGQTLVHMGDEWATWSCAEFARQE